MKPRKPESKGLLQPLDRSKLPNLDNIDKVYLAPNTAAHSHLSEDFRGSPILSPPTVLFAKCEPIGYLGDKLPLWTAAWEKVKNA